MTKDTGKKMYKQTKITKIGSKNTQRVLEKSLCNNHNKIVPWKTFTDIQYRMLLVKMGYDTFRDFYGAWDLTSQE